jgi:DNA-binding transcriptional regulator YhcF (GntR family)
LTDTAAAGRNVFINTDPSRGLPIYLQIVQQIKMGAALAGVPLPSVRRLAPLS